MKLHTCKTAIATASVLALGLMSTSASAALSISPINTTTGIETVLINAVLAPSSGITVVAGSEAYQGTNTATGQQSATYTGFNLAPSSGSTPTLAMADGILLTSGSANLPLSNTTNQFNGFFPGSGSNALLTTLAGTNTNDANALSFSFTVDAGNNAVSAQFVFGTDEFPTQSVTDIFGFFVDGVNYAKFPSGELISNTPGNPTNFILNPVGGGLYGIEYNGLTQVFNVTGLLNSALTTHTITIAVADTSDTIFDSGVFFSGLKATTSGCSGIGCGGDIPEPDSMALLALALMGAVGVGARRRK